MLIQQKLVPLQALNGSVAQLNRASDYGSEGYRFESCRSHFESQIAIVQQFGIFLLSKFIDFTVFIINFMLDFLLRCFADA